ncbi:hypothetical protein F7725_016020, partial [Dissostichus mawsoni]
MVRDVLQSKLGGEKILQEYATTKTLMDGTRRQMVNLLVADMIEQLTGEECREAISFMKHSADESVVKEKMKATFQCRQAMTRDQQASSTVLDVFPRHPWLGKNNMSYLVDQDFTMMFGEEISGKMLARWPTFFKPRILADCKNLHSNVHVDDLLSAQQNSNESGNFKRLTVTFASFLPLGWDSDLSSILLLVHLLPPTSKGHKKSAKISSYQAVSHVVRYLK